MSACAMLNYNNVTAAAWECGKQAAAQYGIVVNSNSGSASKDGFTVAWKYDPAAQTLALQCTDSPWWAPCSLINSKINDAVEDCLQVDKAKMTNMVHG